MLVLDSISHAFRKCSEAAGFASALLISMFVGMSFVIVAALCLKTSEWMILVLIAAIVIGSMLVITCMLVAGGSETRKRASSRVMSMPLHHFARTTQQADDASDACGEPWKGAKPNCSLCRSSAKRLRLGCFTCNVYCEGRK
ncbi:hypothetical protein AWB73_01735 [Caballeronia turbans]|jgi:hypothetical protein|uniref:hypothetical protein n=1 Tax=unclassified Caballeronia TaxID=2646786 RepID=UPI00074B903C|nr:MULTISPECIES: hypothetical protein [unclassified Caballeronia]SAL23943.1 hypothetical protein AWB73_01735 [Caballeronia turbans]